MSNTPKIRRQRPRNKVPWIDAHKRLPPRLETVMVYVTRETSRLAAYDGDGHWLTPSGEEIAVSWWVPLTDGQLKQVKKKIREDHERVGSDED